MAAKQPKDTPPMFKRATTWYGTSPEPVTPYQKAAQVWDDRLGSARVQARNWRAMAFGCLALAVGLSAGVVWQAGRSTITPYVVEIDRTGDVRSIVPATDAYEPTDAQIAWHLARFIEQVRALSIDPVVVRRNWLAAYDYATTEAANTLNDFARQTDPFSKVGQRTVTVEVSSVVRASSDSFDVRWQETAFENGTPVGTTRHRAVLTLRIDPPRTEDALTKNPLGIYVQSLNWSRDRIAEDSP